jgi:hypothetical protein
VPLFLRLKLRLPPGPTSQLRHDPTNNSEMWNIEEFDYGERRPIGRLPTHSKKSGSPRTATFLFSGIISSHLSI